MARLEAPTLCILHTQLRFVVSGISFGLKLPHQTDSIHSGSISFGRFAHEPLLWERRSSFSHNKIQEEVARCSKHKIVTEKKAYFEAQFKKKALLRQCSLGERIGKHFGAGEIGGTDTRRPKDDSDLYQGNKNDASSESSVYIGYRGDFDYMEEAHVNVHFDETSDGSNDFNEGFEYHIEGREILISEPMKLPSSDSVVAEAKVYAGTVTAADTQTVIDCTFSRCSSAEHDVEVEKNIDAYSCHVDGECKVIDLCAGGQKAEKEPDTESIHGDVCPKSMATVESSGTKSKGKVTCTQGDTLFEAAKMPASNLKRMEKPSAMETKTFKQPKLIPSTAKKLARSSNPEHQVTKSTSSVSKTLSSRDSKEIRITKLTKSPATAMTQAPITNQSPTRTKRVTAPKDFGMNTRTPNVPLRSDMRADKRKEMPSRVAQTSHIRKTEINQTLVSTQAKTPIAVKQVRGGLSSKPKPVQSLYNKDERLESKNKNAVKNRPQSNPSLPTTKVVARSSTNLKAEKGPPNSPSHLSTITGCSARKATKTSAVTSLVNNSAHPSSLRNAAQTKVMAGSNKEPKLKNQTVPPKNESIKRRTIIGMSQSTSERTKTCTIRKVTEKPRLQELSRRATRVC